MAFDIGVNVVEVDGTGAPSITGAATSVAAFNVLTQRGVPNRPERITSFPQFVQRYGTYYTGGNGAYLVKGFFDNGGQTAYVNRVVDPAATPAGRTFINAASANTLTLRGGFRGSPDPGVWARDVFVRIVHSASTTARLRETAPAAITGAAIAATVDMSAPVALRVRIDGDPELSITFAPADFVNPAAATRQEIANAINGRTSALIATFVGAGSDQLRLTSAGNVARLNGRWTSLEIVAANTQLGFAAPVAQTFGTPATLTANGTTLDKTGTLKQGDAVVVTDGVTTDHTKVQTIDAATGVIAWAPPLASAAAYTQLRNVTISTAEFDVELARGAGDADHVVETHTGLSMETTLANYAPRVLNHPGSGSKLVQAIDEPAGTGRPVATSGFVPLTGGSEGTPTATHFIGDQALHTGFFAFDTFDVQLVCCERTDSAIATAALAYCENRGDAMFIGAVPQGTVAAGQAIAYGAALQGKNRYGALYGPWISVIDPIGVGDTPRITLSPVGHVAGVYARIANRRGIWKAPAGDEANLLGVLDVETRLSDRDHTAMVKDGSVNGIRPMPGAGIVLDASRTLSTDPRWLYVNVRQLFNYVKSSLRTGLRWARQEPNRDALWRSIQYSTVTPFLMGLWRQGAFGTGSPEETFTVIVDESNNPPDQVEQGRLTVEVYFYPSRPAETIVIIVGQQPSGATAAEN